MSSIDLCQYIVEMNDIGHGVEFGGRISFVPI